MVTPSANEQPEVATEMSLTLYHAVLIYALAGTTVAIAFVLVGVDHVDPAARRAIAFRPLLLPGSALLWPLVLARWIAAERQRARGA